MTAAQSIPLVSVEDYLAAELGGEVRHEYLGGYVYAMAGAKTVHNRVASGFQIAVGKRLAGKPCEPFGSDMKVRVRLPTHTRFYYPDGLVVCEPNGPDDAYQDRPVVVAEVLSEATRRADEGEKREAYLAIPTLRVYLLIEADKPEVRVYRRAGEGFATELYRGLGAVVPLGEVDAELPLGELYARVEFPPPQAG